MAEYREVPGMLGAITQIVGKVAVVSNDVDEIKDCLDRIELVMKELRDCSRHILNNGLQEDTDRFLDELQDDLTNISRAIQSAQTNLKG